MPRVSINIDLSTLGLPPGQHVMTAKSKAPGYAPSLPSEPVIYESAANLQSSAPPSRTETPAPDAE